MIIRYLRIDIKVPAHARYLAVDKSGDIWFYTSKPFINKINNTWHIDAKAGNSCGHLGRYPNDVNWKETCRRIK